MHISKQLDWRRRKQLQSWSWSSTDNVLPFPHFASLLKVVPKIYSLTNKRTKPCAERRTLPDDVTPTSLFHRHLRQRFAHRFAYIASQCLVPRQ